MGNNCCVSNKEGTQMDPTKLEISPRSDKLNMKEGATQDKINDGSTNSSDEGKSKTKRRKRAKKSKEDLSDCVEEVKQIPGGRDETRNTEQSMEGLKIEMIPSHSDLIQAAEDEDSGSDYKSFNTDGRAKSGI
ncbi:unnamed protein product [Moneuplotes crassus]|uniref:Uncharacterized protein n=1 Tax=Euplotes crassus TaxID=5936 RepID=A0AAD1XX32_EUPCR|nr:unnamed protein product [Moneuplotes crassus]